LDADGTKLVREIERYLGHVAFVSGIVDTVRIKFTDEGNNTRPFLEIKLADGRRVYRWYPDGQKIIPPREIPDIEGQEVTLLVTTGHGKSGRLMHLDQVWTTVDASEPARRQSDDQAA
jgi:hypothetical protein